MAGLWKASPTDRKKMMPSTCQGWAISSQKRRLSSAVSSAMLPSEMMSTHLRGRRSTSAPAKGPRKMVGRKPTLVAVARMVAEPVVSVSHQVRAKRTRRLPASEMAWPLQMV